VFTRVVSEFTVAELMKATKKMSSGDASSTLSILNKILKRIILACPSETLKVYNECLNSLTFFYHVEKTKLDLLCKSLSKPVDSPSSFQSICLGEAEEKFFLQRL